MSPLYGFAFGLPDFFFLAGGLVVLGFASATQQKESE
jgi:hypothetical protein